MMRMMQLSPTKTKKMNSSFSARTARATRMALASLSLASIVGAIAIGPGIAAVHAQERGPVRRTIEGKVHDSNDAPLKGAVVYLKDSRTLAVKSFISDDDGVFHFGQLSQNTDYELYAEFQGKRSKSKTISSFDNKNDFNFTLKIDTAK
jgi:Carboxypeptidase regulatory-like domain